MNVNNHHLTHTLTETPVSKSIELELQHEGLTDFPCILGKRELHEFTQSYCIYKKSSNASSDKKKQCDFWKCALSDVSIMHKNDPILYK